MYPHEPEEPEADEHAFVDAFRQLAIDEQVSPDFSARVLGAVRRSQVDAADASSDRSPPQEVASLRPRRHRMALATPLGAGALAAVLAISIGVNLWFGMQLQEVGQSRRALAAAQAQVEELRADVARLQLAAKTSAPSGVKIATDLRNQAYTVASLSQALFPKDDADTVVRRLDPTKPHANIVAAAVLPLTFPPGSATIQPGEYGVLDRLGHVLTLPQYMDYRILLAGHADPHEAATTSAQTLSQDRAAHVKTYLLEHFAIDPARLTVQGYGARQPLALRMTSGPADRNRRVEVINLGAGSSTTPGQSTPAR